MTDKNRKEIKTGDICIITGAYFKRHNGKYVVINSPGDSNWNGNDHCLAKLTKNGAISTTKYSLAFWPLISTTNDHFKRAEADKWNRENAQIEVIGNMKLPDENI